MSKEFNAWFTVDELNAWAEKKLKENPHWAEQPAPQPPAQRTWVGLTEEERAACWNEQDNYPQFAASVEAKLKEKNT